MPRTTVEDNQRLQLRVTPEVKAKLARAAAILQTDLTHFVTRSALLAADAVIEEAEVVKVSERDFSRVLELLEDPPAPNAKLHAVIAALPETL